MDKTYLPSLTVQPAGQPSVKSTASNTDAQPKGVKLSDLNAVKQQIITRAGITLGAIGLLVTASGAIGLLIPNWRDTDPNLVPIMLYLAVFSLPISAIYALMALTLSPYLQMVLIDRLKATEGHPDAVWSDLQISFVEDIEKCLKYVGTAGGGLILGGGALVLHAYCVIASHLIPFPKPSISIKNLVGLNISDFAAVYYFLAVVGIGTVGVMEFQKRWISRKLRGKK